MIKLSFGFTIGEQEEFRSVFASTLQAGQPHTTAARIRRRSGEGPPARLLLPGGLTACGDLSIRLGTKASRCSKHLPKASRVGDQEFVAAGRLLSSSLAQLAIDEASRTPSSSGRNPHPVLNDQIVVRIYYRRPGGHYLPKLVHTVTVACPRKLTF